MSKWLLIMWFGGPSAGGPLTVPGFSTQQTCEAAAAAIRESGLKFYVGSAQLCVKVD